jgi:hypothetical protein
MKSYWAEGGRAMALRMLRLGAPCGSTGWCEWPSRTGGTTLYFDLPVIDEMRAAANSVRRRSRPHRS